MSLSYLGHMNDLHTQMVYEALLCTGYRTAARATAAGGNVCLVRAPKPGCTAVGITANPCPQAVCSGRLHTAQCGLDQQRDMYTVGSLRLQSSNM